jgi:hypothetical protein
MKHIFVAIFSIALLSGLTGCIKNEPVTFDSNQIEFDAATWNANGAGLTYPILARVPVQGAVTGTSAPSITRTTATVPLRINLLGKQQSAAKDFTYRVVTAESTAVDGTHFSTVSGTGSIPANSSFGIINIGILNPGATSGSRILVLELTENANFKPNVNYAKVGISISQL